MQHAVMPGMHRISLDGKPKIAGALISSNKVTKSPLIELYEAPILKIEK